MITLRGAPQDEARRVRDPKWTTWTAPAASATATLYGLLQVYWSLGHRPANLSPVGTDLVAFTGWGGVTLCAVAAIAATTLTTLRTAVAHSAVRVRVRRRGLLVVAWAASFGMVASSALLLLDVVGALAPGLGIRFYPVGAMSRAACLTSGVLLGLAALSHQRRTRAGCARCGRVGEVRRLDRVPRWAFWAAYVSMAGCLGRIVAQYCVGFGPSPLHSATAIEFEIGFVLGGTLLPMALVHSWGRVWPRWVPVLAGRPVPRRLVLWPAAGISGGLVVYFGLMLLKMISERLHGRNPFPDSGSGPVRLPEAFFWVAVPAYWIWGVGMAVAAVAFHRLTRPGCRRCGR
ncbi:hypothetical protein [Actinomadura oligospora]|uniref:hypothetical protein n=1 Tax=Actinomadura oligospora TaxID=111804 RepID=UPI0004B00D9E|nr:hypothetical protein [Actinomadura oligospora]